MAENSGDGSLKLLRQLKDAESSGEAGLRAAQAEAVAEVAELKKLIAQQLVEATDRARVEREEKLQTALAKAQADAQAIVAKARSEAATIRPFTPAEVEALFPSAVQALFADVTPVTPPASKSPKK